MSYANTPLITTFNQFVNHLNMAIKPTVPKAVKAVKAVKDVKPVVAEQVESDVEESDAELEVKPDTKPVVAERVEGSDADAGESSDVKPATKKAKKATSKNESCDESETGSDGSKKRASSSAVSMTMVNKMYEMFKDDLADFNKKDVKSIADLFIKTLITEVLDGEKVTLTNNMTFKRSLRAERTHKVPAKKDKEGNIVTKSQEVNKKAHYVMTMEVKPALKSKFQEVVVVPAVEVEEDE
jgi:nucleoid DNA-binding protein